MLIKDSGIVLAARRTEDEPDGSLLGRRTGRSDCWPGCHEREAPDAQVLEPGNEIEIVCYHRDGQATHYLKEASLVGKSPVERDSLPHLAANLAALELLNLVCVPGASLDDAVVDTASEYLSAAKGADPMLVFLAFAIKLLGALGLSPDTVACVHCGAAPDDGLYSPRDGVSFCAEHRAPMAESVSLTAEVVSAARCATASTGVFDEAVSRVCERSWASSCTGPIFTTFRVPARSLSLMKVIVTRRATGHIRDRVDPACTKRDARVGVGSHQAEIIARLGKFWSAAGCVLVRPTTGSAPARSTPPRSCACSDPSPGAPATSSRPSGRGTDATARIRTACSSSCSTR
jgi:hypothetical protein